jgi:type VI secretion system protein ImpC
MPGRLDFSFEFRGMGEQAPREHGVNEPIRILLLADLGGRENRGVAAAKPLSARVPARVDVDNFDELLRRISPALTLALGGEDEGITNLSIEFAELDDFGPDALYQRIELFLSLRKLRGQLLDPATYDEAAAFLKRGTSTDRQDYAGPAAQQETPATDSGSEFEQLMGGSPVREKAAVQSAHSAIDRLIGSIVEPHIEKAVDPQQAQLVSAVDDSISTQMRSVLHHPDFQSLEALWRGVHDLVTSLETSEELQIFLLDVTRSELVDDFQNANGQLDQSALYQLLVEKGLRTPGGLVWSLLVGDLYFGATGDDLTLVAGLGTIASQAGAPFLAAARPELLGCSAIHELPDPHDWRQDEEAERAWNALRGTPAAHWIGLAFPRVLTRLPYGKEADEIDQFAFEEVSQAADHEAYLWANPALSCAKLAAMSWIEAETLCEPGSELDLTDLPACTYIDEDERKLLPGAEALLSERTADYIAERGIMPIMSYRDRNSARLLRFQSIADPPAALRGAWR